MEQKKYPKKYFKFQANNKHNKKHAVEINLILKGVFAKNERWLTAKKIAFDRY